MVESKFPATQCPRCGASIRPTITVNENGPVHRADKMLFRVTGMFFPHTDVEYSCSCGIYWHETWPLKGELTMASSSMAGQGKAGQQQSKFPS